MTPVKTSEPKNPVEVLEELVSALLRLTEQVEQIAKSVDLDGKKDDLINKLTARVVVLEACNSDLQQQVAQLQKRLQEVEDAVKSGDCHRGHREMDEFSKQIAEAAARRRDSLSK